MKLNRFVPHDEKSSCSCYPLVYLPLLISTFRAMRKSYTINVSINIQTISCSF